ncbi:MAG: autotransporter-associated beta strand repeat-containing protein [Kiritimatiellae bacterium]|nr:autotransporter-associated beta strand repeat-containing protein [Kiritimatiellia bacterium]
MFVTGDVFARSITGVRHVLSQGASSLNVTLETGTAGDAHALYIAYDTEDKGGQLADWAALQRGCNVAADATSATIPVSPLLTGAGYTVCRVFLTTSAAPYDTLIESLRQTGTQYIDTGIYPDSNTVAVIDAKLDSRYPRQQRFFGVSSSDKTAVFSFDAYVNSGGNIATACQSGEGNWKATSRIPTVRSRIYLSAAENHRVVIFSDGTAETNTYNTVCTNTSAATLPILAHKYFTNGAMDVRNIPQGADLYGFSMTNEGVCVCNCLPCTLNGRAGVYDTATDSFRWSASGDDFLIGGGALPCSLLDGEAQLAAAPASVDLSVLPDPETGAVWKGSYSGNWNLVDGNWTLDGVAGQAWADGKTALFNDNASVFTVNVPSGTTVTPAATVFDATSDYTLAGAGTIAGTGAFQKYQGGKLTITGVNHSFTGDVVFNGGEIVLPSNKDSSDITSGSLGNPRAERSVIVSNATLRIQGQNPFGGGGRSSTPIKAAIRLSNSTLELTTNFCFNAGDIYVHNSDIRTHGGLSYYLNGKVGEVGDPYSGTFWGALSVANLYFSGNRQIVLTGSGGNALSGMSISKFAKQGVIDVPDMTGNDDVDVYIRMPILWSSGNTGGDPGIASGFRKTGAGTLRLDGNDYASAVNSTYTGDVDVVEGTLQISVGTTALGAKRTTALGAVRYPRTFTVHPGAMLQFTCNDTAGQYHNRNNLTIHINGGTLAQNNNCCNGLGHLILENAKLTYGGALMQGDWFRDNGDGTTNWHYNLTWPTFGFHDGVEFRGTNTYTFGNGSADGRIACFSFGNNDGTSSDAYVAEISGKGTPDEIADVTFNVKLVDAPPWYAWRQVGSVREIRGTNQVGHALNMRKTGPGLLSLKSNLSDHSGRIEVAEGILRLDVGGRGSSNPCFECPTNGPLGDLSNPNYTVCVNGGMLWLTTGDQLGQANAVNNFTLAVTNGTLRQSAGAIANPLPFLDLYDATIEYGGANTGSNGDLSQAQPWGTFIFAQRVRFDGTRPYDLQNISGTSYFSLGWQSDSYQMPSTYKSGAIDQHGKTEFYVADITQDANPDVTIGVVLKFPCHWNGNGTNSKYANYYFRTGLLKTGPGTLRLNCNTAANKYYSEATRVNGGTLLVDAQTFNSTNVIVQSDAYVGGTGTVQRVTIEQGGGFTAAPGQTGALTLNALELPADGVVALDIPYIGEEEGMIGYRVPVVRSAGLEGAKWRVTVNGETVPNGYAANAIVQNGIVYGVISRSGTVFMIR